MKLQESQIPKTKQKYVEDISKKSLIKEVKFKKLQLHKESQVIPKYSVTAEYSS